MLIGEAKRIGVAGKTGIVVLTFSWLLLVAAVWGQADQGGNPQKTDGFSRMGCPVSLLRDGEFFPRLLDAVAGARKEIVMAYFLFKADGDARRYPGQILAALVEAFRRGVPVTVLVENDDAPRSGVNRDNRDAVLAMKQAGLTVLLDSPRRTTHCKLAVIDRRFTFLGSHNLTQSALKYNHELSVLIDSPQVAAEALAYFKSVCRTAEGN